MLPVFLFVRPVPTGPGRLPIRATEEEPEGIGFARMQNILAYVSNAHNWLRLSALYTRDWTDPTVGSAGTP